MEPSVNPIAIGVDVGQLHDPTAIAVAEVSREDAGKVRERDEFSKTTRVRRSEYNIRSIQRLPLGTSYPAVAERIAKMLCNQHFRGREVRVFIDVTGVGRPVYEDLLEEVALHAQSRNARINPINFAHGEKYNRETGTLGKAYLVSRLQSLLQGGRVHAPDTPEVRTMLEELRVYEIKIDQDGHDTYGAFQTGKHDDLATALGLACLEDPFQYSHVPLWSIDDDEEVIHEDEIVEEESTTMSTQEMINHYEKHIWDNFDDEGTMFNFEIRGRW